ncbi:predicted protein [Naegleria gruberi]|uniref:Predicted protein n=1 Tax=Naegleria gruberi TaxID=5762 RepID=D2W016_NAEGR|nr:uncharacterized protein NAEGRDRAFT_74696 [Naegleria gruberi]EFC37668.1 predicted protein [Naegleria gruberi]|eukprot:XP_002670412.1 predicted protein [Naegleria gruberi strain NEG-M]
MASTLNGTSLNKDMLIAVGAFLPLGDLNNFARCDKNMLEVFFNLTVEKVEAIAKRKKDLSKKNIDAQLIAIKDNYKKDESCNVVQQVIWKPIVLHYFPNYSQTLNIKNWMHVMRRRVTHLQNKFPNELPLLKERVINTSIDKVFRIDKDSQFIENCEWEYECPLKSNAFKVVSPNVKYCKVCKENVYEVFSMNELKTHVEQNHCVAFSEQVMPGLPSQLKRLRKGKVLVVPTTIAPPPSSSDDDPPSKKKK